MSRPRYEIDGKDFDTLEGFFAIVWPLLAGYPSSGKNNLDAFNDILYWPSSPGGPYELVWRNSALSRQRLGHTVIARELEGILQTCHPSNRPEVSERLRRAREGEGPTMFDWLVEIIQENSRYVTLHLE